jgi:hypothetical protein
MMEMDSVSKQVTQRFVGMERSNLKKLNNLEVKEQYQVKILNGFASLENLDDDDDGDISMAWESIREDIKTSAT